MVLLSILDKSSLIYLMTDIFHFLALSNNLENNIIRKPKTKLMFLFLYLKIRKTTVKNYALCYFPLLWRLQNVCQNSWELWLKSGKKLIWAWIWTIYNCILNIKLNLKLSHHTDCCQGIFTILSLYGSSTMATLYWCHYVRGGEEIKKGREI